MEPVAGIPSAPVTLTCATALGCPPCSLWVTASEVSVEMPLVALCARQRMPVENVSAIPSPATKLSRRLRRFMPLTCTCSKFHEKLRITWCPPRRTQDLIDCIRPGRDGAMGHPSILPATFPTTFPATVFAFGTSRAPLAAFL